MENFTPEVLLVDGRNLLFRTTWTNQALYCDGRPTGGTYGFLRTLIMMWHTLDKPAVHVCWEGSNNWRFEVYPEYKAGRGKDPRSRSEFDTTEAVHLQEPRLGKILEAASIKQWIPKSGECDDALFTLSQRLAEEDIPVAILSQDRDLYQAVGPACCVIRAQKDDTWELIDETRVFKDLGVVVKDLADMKALAGDASDNIPGVRGIGPKNAANLLALHGTLEEVISAAQTEITWRATAKQRAAVASAAEDLRVYRRLVQLHSTTLLRRPVNVRDADFTEVSKLLEEDMLYSLTRSSELSALCTMGSRPAKDLHV